MKQGVFIYYKDRRF